MIESILKISYFKIKLFQTLIFAIFFLLFLTIASKSANAAPICSISPTNISWGDSIHVSASGLPSNRSYDLRFDSPPGILRYEINGFATTDSSGRIEKDFTFNSASPYDPGLYRAVLINGFGTPGATGCDLGDVRFTAIIAFDIHVDGPNVTFTWGPIPNWPNGASYFLAVEKVPNAPGTSYCPPQDNQITPFPKEFTSANGDSFSWGSAPTGFYIASLYTFGAEIASCVPFEVTDGSVTGENPCRFGACSTGLGSIPFSPTDLGGKILAIGVGLAGGLALILMVIGAIRVLTSQGDQQRLNGGREMIVAAIAGLLFLVLAVVILEFIGVKILGGVPTGN